MSVEFWGSRHRWPLWSLKRLLRRKPPPPRRIPHRWRPTHPSLRAGARDLEIQGVSLRRHGAQAAGLVRPEHDTFAQVVDSHYEQVFKREARTAS
ncbi:hypothetical protein Mpe_B0023 (plasmid) [Methylibium petroleiphilum PM1]|uniref:Uncharacterized protein n=1 Tax=Methylibium petroleiphilum (strain ATCC BAA-1232 / LMG 22953 / PM1) TaxID=420662 RepID=A2SML5_METPP|nr:hypothetical protein Mpe_B0023 [Methylibium petroleiphilum PM1]